jgi:hypothetical protein
MTVELLPADEHNRYVVVICSEYGVAKSPSLNQSRHLCVTALPDSTVKTQSSSLVRLPCAPRASLHDIMRH